MISVIKTFVRTTCFLPLVHPYLPGEEGLLKETYDKVGAHQFWSMKYRISTCLYGKVKPKDGQKTKARLFRVEPYTVLKCSSLVLISFSTCASTCFQLHSGYSYRVKSNSLSHEMGQRGFMPAFENGVTGGKNAFFGCVHCKWQIAQVLGKRVKCTKRFKRLDLKERAISQKEGGNPALFFIIVVMLNLLSTWSCVLHFI